VNRKHLIDLHWSSPAATDTIPIIAELGKFAKEGRSITTSGVAAFHSAKKSCSLSEEYALATGRVSPYRS